MACQTIRRIGHSGKSSAVCLRISVVFVIPFSSQLDFQFDPSSQSTYVPRYIFRPFYIFDIAPSGMATPNPTLINVDLTANHQPEILKAIAPFIALAAIAVLCRFWSRKLKKVPCAADDWTILAGLVSNVLQTAQARELVRLTF